ncbi:zinc finger BED domain-containing protein 4-like [Maniola jurtina]|uniref:zinc finger BED domain-containing protein 4-like n=1 Tax=Maniola jurtina TaxID=191418 RepID=UPI001E6892BA|nr:zinc finger BED domain-containing protein 4-like [Maniola jurtina]
MEENSDKIDINKVKIKHFTVNPLFSKSKNSFSWKYFGQLILENEGKRKYVFTEQVFCSSCLENAKNQVPDSPFGCVKIKSYSSKASTGNLIRHLKDDHSLLEEKNPAAATSKSLTTFFKVSLSRPTTSAPSSSKSQNKWMLARDLCLWLCRSLTAFDTVSNEGFKDFLIKYNVIYKIEDLPSRTTVSREALSDIYDCMLAHIKQDILAKIGTHAALTTDLWQDLYRRCSYITYTLQYIADDANEMQNYTLATRLFEGKKTGEALSAFTQGIISSFGLEGKSLYLVTDSGANVKRISQNLQGIQSHLCLGHGLHNLVTVDGIKKTPQVQNLVVKCKKVVKTLRYRLPEIEEEADKEQRRILTEIDDVHDHLEDDENFPFDPVPESDVPSDEGTEVYFSRATTSSASLSVPSIKSATPTRWHSTLAMLQSLSSKCNRKPVNAMLAKYNMSELKFDDKEWELIEDLTKFLTKFKPITEVLCTQTNCSINFALVFRSEIKDACEALNDDEKLVMLHMKRNMAEMLNHRFPITKIIVAAALLDCRFTKLQEIDNFMESNNTTRVDFLVNCIKEVVPACELEAQFSRSSTSNKGDQDNFLVKLVEKHAVTFNDDGQDFIEKECLKYLVSCNASDLKDGNVIKYWQERQAAFPLLYKLAKAILSVPATSTPSERVFSIAGLTVTAKRSRLSPSRVDKIIFVHDNYSRCKAAVN